MNLDAILTELIVSFEILTERNRADLCLTKKDAWSGRSISTDSHRGDGLVDVECFVAEMASSGRVRDARRSHRFGSVGVLKSDLESTSPILKPGERYGRSLISTTPTTPGGQNAPTRSTISSCGDFVYKSGYSEEFWGPAEIELHRSVRHHRPFLYVRHHSLYERDHFGKLYACRSVPPFDASAVSLERTTSLSI